MVEHSSPASPETPTAAAPPLNLGPRYKAAVWAFVVVLCGLTLYPAFASGARDSFPFSTYPMFAARRGSPSFHKLEMLRKDGSSAPVPPEWVGSSEVLQAKVSIARAVRGGKKSMRKLCARVAERAASEGEAAIEFRFRELRYDPIGYYEGQKPLRDRTLYRCDRSGERLK